ncbi:MAG TPA: hypothetical protein VMD47_06250 [Candidatus Acidoferrales bacterium]|nr:hypothetical protein [Candidatus Acidoferrales bacterium]
MLPVLLAAWIHADVLISAGHEGRPASCARFPHRACNLGARGERQWTPIVADEATRVLRAHGLRVIREPADFGGRYAVSMAIFIHFDGASPRCTSGASIGYHNGAGARAARLWRALYEPLFPFRFMPDDFSIGLRDYYGFRQVDAHDGALVLELGEITCPAQHAWLAARLDALGELIAFDVSRTIGKGDVPRPAKFEVQR